MVKLNLPRSVIKKIRTNTGSPFLNYGQAPLKKVLL